MNLPHLVFVSTPVAGECSVLKLEMDEFCKKNFNFIIFENGHFEQDE